VRISYDSEVDALYVRFIETTVTTKRVAEGITIDYDAEGHGILFQALKIINICKRSQA
jgi:uncharacterized protein YuzE